MALLLGVTAILFRLVGATLGFVLGFFGTTFGVSLGFTALGFTATAF